jgi:hypothetical protein
MFFFFILNYKKKKQQQQQQQINSIITQLLEKNKMSVFFPFCAWHKARYIIRFKGKTKSNDDNNYVYKKRTSKKM